MHFVTRLANLAISGIIVSYIFKILSLTNTQTTFKCIVDGQINKSRRRAFVACRIDRFTKFSLTTLSALLWLRKAIIDVANK